MARTLASYVGPLVAGLMTLETMLRLLRARHEGTTLDSKGLVNVKAGDELREDVFSNYAQLSKLLAWFRDSFPLAVIDPEAVVRLRHALAHGRPISATAGGEIQLVKFSDANGGEVRVEYAEMLNDAWFAAQDKLLREATSAVFTVGRQLGVFDDPVKR